MIIHCGVCQKMPNEIRDVVLNAAADGVTPELYAKQDGTYNSATGKFYCTPCYIAIGMPLGKAT